MTSEQGTPTEHWEAVYRAKLPTAVSWYQPHLKQSLALVRTAKPGTEARVIDIGGGASTLVDDLLEHGYKHITVLDISGQALEESKRRLGTRAGQVAWIEGDVTKVALPSQAYDIWHDRAVFHFLVRPEDRAKYVQQMRQALRPGASVIMATFALDGPQKCSGLDVARYSPESLSRELGTGFSLVDSVPETHQTPAGMIQNFVYCHFRVTGNRESRTGIAAAVGG